MGGNYPKITNCRYWLGVIPFSLGLLDKEVPECEAVSRVQARLDSLRNVMRRKCENMKHNYLQQ